MSRITDYVLDKEASGELEYDNFAREYVKTEQYAQEFDAAFGGQEVEHPSYDEYKERRAGLWKEIGCE